MLAFEKLVMVFLLCVILHMGLLSKDCSETFFSMALYLGWPLY